MHHDLPAWTPILDAVSLTVGTAAPNLPSLKLLAVVAIAAVRFSRPARTRARSVLTIDPLLLLPPSIETTGKRPSNVERYAHGKLLSEAPTLLHESLCALMEARDPETLRREFGGLDALASRLQTDLSTGLLDSLSNPDHDHNDVYFLNAADEGHDEYLIAARKKVFGENTYPRKKPKSIWSCLWEAFSDTTLLILVVCAALSLGFGIKSDGLGEGWYDGASIAVAVALVVLITAASNYKQSRSFQRLAARERDSVQVQVVRGGRTLLVPIAGVVVGDVVRLRTGDVVPADGLLIEARSLAVDESSFTGETEHVLPDPSIQPFLRSGSKIQDGDGSMLVARVGVHTEWGRMMLALADPKSSSKPTPLQARLVQVANLVGHVGLSVALVVLVVLVTFYFVGHSSPNGDPKFRRGETTPTQVMDSLVHIFSIVVTIIVVAVPEGLPLAVTLTLAYSMRKMMRDNALVRRLAACETMGSATTICTDKTGTLTTNQMTVVKAWFAGKSYDSEGDAKHIKQCLRSEGSVAASHFSSLMYQGISLNTSGTVFASGVTKIDIHDGAVAVPIDNNVVGYRSSRRRPNDGGDIIDGSTDTNIEVSGSPTEQAILWWGLKIGMSYGDVKERNSILHVEPFNSKKKRAGVLVETTDGRLFVHWKGAAEIILSMCNTYVELTNSIDRDSTVQPLCADKRQGVANAVERMANSSLRCVAFAYCELTGDSLEQYCKMHADQALATRDDANDECGEATSPPPPPPPPPAAWILPQEELTLMAVVGMKDPCRQGVRKAVETVQEAGVVVRMVTGDNLGTAKAIARECGILAAGAGSPAGHDQPSVEGPTFRSWSESERMERAPRLRVLARATPEDKLTLVKALQALGEVVAVTGDGTNDALALNEADIGLSMGIQGTEVAKESSDVIILDDDFTSIVKVVRWGRSVYFNIQKFLQFQLTVNAAALAINFVAAVTSGDVPLTAVQLLWVNLIMDTLGALALATERPTDELMKRPPVAPAEALITKQMWWNLAFQAAYQIATLLTLQFRGVQILRLSSSPDVLMRVRRRQTLFCSRNKIEALQEKK